MPSETTATGEGRADTAGVAIHRTTVRQPTAARQNKVSQIILNIVALGTLISGKRSTVRDRCLRKCKKARFLDLERFHAEARWPVEFKRVAVRHRRPNRSMPAIG